MSDWFRDQRLAWIAEMLQVYGFINRVHVMRKFGVSQPQASKDLALFMTQHPDAMHYNLIAKRYEGSVAKGRALIEQPTHMRRRRR